MRCLYTNLDTFHNKRTELLTRIHEVKPDIIGLTEVQSKVAAGLVNDIDLAIDGYTKYINLCGRGVVLYIKDCLRSTEVTPSTSFDTSCWCSLPLKNKDSLLIGVIYRSPNATRDQTCQMNTLITEMVKRNHSHLMIMGDFNYPEINWNTQTSDAPDDSPPQNFLSNYKDCFLHQHVLSPTHYRGQQQANILDLILTNEPDMIDKLHYSEPIGRSHHLVLDWIFKGYGCVQKVKTKKYFVNRGDYDGMRLYLEEIDWISRLSSISVDSMWEVVSTEVLAATDTYIPSKTFTSAKSHDKRPEWMNARVLARIKKKKSAFTRFKETRAGKDYQEYVQARNMAKSEMRRAVRDYEKEIAKRAKSNPKAFYRYVNSKTKSHEKIPDLKGDDGNTITNNKDKAEVFNNFFSSVFTVEDLDHFPDLPAKARLSELTDITFTPSDVQKLLQNLNSNKSPGPDNIQPRILKECAEVLAIPLHILFTASLEQGRLPTAWKEAKIIPIFKKGTRTVASNYRPISLTSVCCKTMEKLVRDSLLHHMINNEFLSDTQHGFVKGRSCTTQLLKIVDKISELLDEGFDSNIIFLDFSKAFDSVPHQRLLLKLQSYGVGGCVLEWIRSFLLSRRQQVEVGGAFSSWLDVLSGVPQGSVLGPVLFVCYINDMPDYIKSFIYLYADDAKLLYRVSDEEIAGGVSCLQSDLDTLTEWSRNWQLSFNVEKCKVMHIGKSNCSCQYTMQDVNGRPYSLHETKEEKDLGVWIDPTMKFSIHVAHAANKAQQVLGLVNRSFTYKDSDLLKQLYVALIRPHLEYGNAVWHPFLKKDIQLLERVQHRATKLIPTLRHMCYEDRLKALDLPSLAYRRLRGDAIETYKYLHRFYTLDSNVLLPLNQCTSLSTRGHCLKLMKRDCKSSVRANVLGFRIVNFWNNLPEHVVTSGSVNAFKNSLDKHCYHLRYCTALEDLWKI